jgi:hypothetical protein
VKKAAFSGQQLAQIDNPDPFAPPVWRSPVYHTPGWVITMVQLIRVVVALIKFWPGTRCWTWCSPSSYWPGARPDGPARSPLPAQ